MLNRTCLQAYVRTKMDIDIFMRNYIAKVAVNTTSMALYNQSLLSVTNYISVFCREGKGCKKLQKRENIKRECNAYDVKKGHTNLNVDESVC